jgi:hypothetical protein
MMLLQVLVGMFLNAGLLAALLFAPCLLLMAFWYRKQLPQTLLVWKKPELVIITIGFAAVTLVLFVVGISSFFTHFGYLRSTQIDPETRQQLYTIGIACFLMTAALFITYMAIRTLFVQIVTESGIVMNDRFLRIPDMRNVVPWYQVADYYIKSDYPNVVFSLIIQKEPLKFERIHIKVPVYSRDAFEELLENKMNEVAIQFAGSEYPSKRFYEN